MTASSQQAPDQGPQGLFNGMGIWHAQRPPKYPEWVILKFDMPARRTKLSMEAQPERAPGTGEFKRSPKSFVLQGSPDGTTWSDLLKVQNNQYDQGGVWKSWSFRNSNSYLYYRIYIMANDGDPDLLTVAGLKLE